MSKAKIEVTAILVLIGILALSVLILERTNYNTYEVTITDTYVKNSDDNGRYLVSTELDDGTVRVFENTDSLVNGKMNSSDVHAKIKSYIGKKCKVETVGYRCQLFSMYENILNIEVLEDETEVSDKVDTQSEVTGATTDTTQLTE